MIYYILLAVSIVFLDQLTKWLAVISLKGAESYPLWEGVFHFTYVENTGSAFGMLKDQRWVFMLASTVIIVAFSVIFALYYKKMSHLLRTAVVFMVAGGIGNMIDRIFVGYVVDFFDFTLIDFAVFNVADSFVCIGAGLFVLWYIIDTVREMKKGKIKDVFGEAEVSEYEKEETVEEKNGEVTESEPEETTDKTLKEIAKDVANSGEDGK